MSSLWPLSSLWLEGAGVSPRRLRLEGAVGAAALVLCVLTLAWPTWIETVFRFDPDRGNGSFEYGIAAAFAVLACGLAARVAIFRRRVASEPS